MQSEAPPSQKLVALLKNNEKGRRAAKFASIFETIGPFLVRRDGHVANGGGFVFPNGDGDVWGDLLAYI